MTLPSQCVSHPIYLLTQTLICLPFKTDIVYISATAYLQPQWYTLYHVSSWAFTRSEIRKGASKIFFLLPQNMFYSSRSSVSVSDPYTGANDFAATRKDFFITASANQSCCSDLLRKQTIIVVIKIHIIVETIDIVTTTILVCWGCINKMFSWYSNNNKRPPNARKRFLLLQSLHFFFLSFSISIYFSSYTQVLSKLPIIFMFENRTLETAA